MSARYIRMVGMMSLNKALDVLKNEVELLEAENTGSFLLNPYEAEKKCALLMVLEQMNVIKNLPEYDFDEIQWSYNYKKYF